ncbi:type II secretion system F family protein [Bacillus alkalicellulosilyticus]|uniref:type II secretion system F family protein n=1 Tax=Alkalihalobacterium alkalicellulosilyticum TaxID=1912214 RepID=UPI0009985AAA|nr:type II secretion system F family protein [Bacillus alkalicellulosilyticus]
MAQYRYKGRNRRGKTVQGKLQAESEREIRLQLRDQGIMALEVKELSGALHKEISIGSGVKPQDFVIYMRQFATLLKAGITVVEATEILAEQTSSKALKKVLMQVETELRSGNPLSESCEQHPKVFPPLYINMIKAGEIGGNLDEVLDRLAFYYEKQYKLVQKVKSAITYPAAVGVVTVAVVIFLLSSVVPTFATMFESFDAELPALTQFVLAAGDVVQSYWWTIIVFVLVVIIGFKVINDNKQSRLYLHFIILKTPLFGKLLQKAELARVTRTLSSLFSSAVPVLQAMVIVEKVVKNNVIKNVIRDSRSSLEKGESLSKPMEESWVFPPLVTQMISVGESTGALDAMLDKVAEFYEDEVDTATEQLKSLIEPILIVVLAGVVGVIVMSIMIPMFKVFDAIQ